MGYSKLTVVSFLFFFVEIHIGPYSCVFVIVDTLIRWGFWYYPHLIVPFSLLNECLIIQHFDTTLETN